MKRLKGHTSLSPVTAAGAMREVCPSEPHHDSCLGLGDGPLRLIGEFAQVAQVDPYVADAKDNGGDDGYG